MTVRKVPKNQVPAALHDNQDAVTVSQDGDTVTVRQTGELVSGYAGDDVISSGGDDLSDSKLVVLDLNLGEPVSESGYVAALPDTDVVPYPLYLPTESQELYGVGEGHMVIALKTEAFASHGNTVWVEVSNTDTSEQTTLTINFVPNE